MKKTLFDKIWEKHVVREVQDDLYVLYIDKHLIHEVTSPQAFASLEKRGLKVLRPQQILATADHNVPTTDQDLPIKDALSAKQVSLLTENCKKHGIELFGLGHPYQGIVHVIGPELGITQPGMTIVCGDSHTSTHGAFGTIAFGIGTSEVEMVLATQCLLQTKPKQMRIEVNGSLSAGVTAKDVILYIISQLGTGGATGFFIEYAGSTIKSLSMEGRMTICNMSIEMGARGGLIAPDDTTFNYLKGKVFAPKAEEWETSVKKWSLLTTDDGAHFDKIFSFKAEDIPPMVTYGTHPGMGVPINAAVPFLNSAGQESSEEGLEKALHYMGLQSGQIMSGIPVQHVFIGSCTNARVEDFRLAASVVKGKQKHENIRALIVPGSQQVAKQLVEEGLDKIFEAAGFVIRQPGCSACLAMNGDTIPSGEYCVSTSNRNFEGRQGSGARTILASPLTAALASITGEITDIRTYQHIHTHN
jgi:3-isopropylmalate/(R)-2-methylmalate dehydratase large subunit